MSDVRQLIVCFECNYKIVILENDLICFGLTVTFVEMLLEVLYEKHG